MRFIVADWGTARLRGYLIENKTNLDQVPSNDGVSALQKGPHRDVFLRQCGRWLETEPDALVLLAGMVGNREGWLEAPYAISPQARLRSPRRSCQWIWRTAAKAKSSPACSASSLPVPPTSCAARERRPWVQSPKTD
jgi:2-keto-3-deoxy-galactonokinase